MKNEFEGHNVVSARRRLVRGVFSVPAALTLVSGSVYAAASNQRSLANAVERKVDAPDNPDGTWLRVPLYRLGSDSGKKWSTWVSGKDVVGLIPTSVSTSVVPVPYLKDGDFQRVGAGEKSDFYTMTPPFIRTGQPSQSDLTWSNTGTWVAVRVDATGKIIGVEPIASGGAALSMTCWYSVVGYKPM